jgi:hypothetical protein
MLYWGIKAEGSLDISTSLLTGQLRTGDAGVIVMFLSFMLMLSSLVRIPDIRRLGFRVKDNRQ